MFALTINDAVALAVPTCPVLGVELLYEGGSGVHNASPTIDRLVPERGYVPENCAVISLRANQIKSNATAEELNAVWRWVTLRQSEGT